MLGDERDHRHRAKERIFMWNFSILLTILPRIWVYTKIGQIRFLLKWMVPYFVLWQMTVYSAGWDAHPHTNPFKHYVKGSLVHFIFSLVFFTMGGSESFCLNLKRLYPSKADQIKQFMAIYIGVYCTLFGLGKILPGLLGFLGERTLPIFEHAMLFGHVYVDAYGTATLLEGDGLMRLDNVNGNQDIENRLNHGGYVVLVSSSDAPPLRGVSKLVV